MSEEMGLQFSNEQSSDNNLNKVSALSFKIGEEIRRLLAQIRECRIETTNLVSTVNDTTIKQQ